MSAESGAVERSNNLMAVGRYELARSTALDGLAGGDENGELLAIAAQCTAELDGWAAGESLYRQALASNPTFKVRAMAAHGLGRAGLLDEALPMFDALLAEDPRQPVVRQVLADVLLSTQSLSDDEATHVRVEQLLAEELKLSPTSPMVHFTVGRLAMKRDDWDQARVAIERGLALDPDNATGLSLLGAVGMAQDDNYDEAFENLRSAVRADPTDKPAAQLAELAKMRQLLDEARSSMASDQAVRRHTRATRVVMGAFVAGGVGFVTMLLGRLADARVVELIGVVLVIACCGVALVFLVIADRAEKSVRRGDTAPSGRR